LEHIKRAQLFVQNNGVKRIVRVISKQNITSKMQFTRMGREAYNKDADIAASFEEAEAILDMDMGREVQ
jgi:hypothetical protein